VHSRRRRRGGLPTIYANRAEVGAQLPLPHGRAERLGQRRTLTALPVNGGGHGRIEFPGAPHGRGGPPYGTDTGRLSGGILRRFGPASDGGADLSAATLTRKLNAGFDYLSTVAE
jgi:hypothetical protein